MIAPGVSDVVDDVSHFIVIQFPVERRHGEARGLARRCRGPRASEHDVNDGIGHFCLNARAGRERREYFCDAGTVFHMTSGAVINIYRFAMRWLSTVLDALSAPG